MLTPTSMLPFLMNPAAGLNALSLSKKSAQPQLLLESWSKNAWPSTETNSLSCPQEHIFYSGKRYLTHFLGDISTVMTHDPQLEVNATG